MPPGEAESRDIERRKSDATSSPSAPPIAASRMLLGQQLAEDPGAIRANRQADADLALPRRRASQLQVGDQFAQPMSSP